MPLAMNFDLVKSHTSSDKCEQFHECPTALDLKLSKSPLSNGTNRPVVLSRPPLGKPRVRPSPTTPPSRINRKIDLEKLTRSSSNFQISLPNLDDESWSAVASSADHLLVGGGNSSSLRLFDFQGKQIRLIDIKTFAAFDLAWSTVLNAFLIAGYDSLQMYQIEKDQLTLVEHLHLANKKDNYFWSITCHETDLFLVLSDGLESIWRVSLPDFQRIQTYSGSEIRESNADDRISCIRTNGLSIAMTLRQRRTFQWRVDLFDYNTMTRTHRGLTIGYGIGAFNFQERAMLAAVDDHQWLVIAGSQVKPNALTLMDDRTGEIKQVERLSNEKEEFFANICTNDYRKQQSQMISLIIRDKTSDQSQICIVQEQQA